MFYDLSVVDNDLLMFSGTRLPNVPRPRMSICILADAADIDRAKQIELEYMSVDDLKKCVFSSFSFIMVTHSAYLSPGSTRTKSSSRSSQRNTMPSWLLRL